MNYLRSLLILFAIPICAPAQTTFRPDGIDAPKTFPRNAHAMAYDFDNQRILMFGGADERQVLSDLFQLDGDSWKKIEADGPGPRTFANLVYAGPGSGMLLFGGNSVLFGNENAPPSVLGDSWLFRRGNWTRMETGLSPEPRAEASAAYDPVERRVILFGGYTLSNGEIRRLGDTWELRNGRWKKLSGDGPSPRNGAAMAFDRVRRSIVLFGGSTSDSSYGPQTGETWVLVNDRWNRLDTAKPPNIFNAAMSGGAGTDTLIRFGGWDGSGRLDETWALRADGWFRLGGKSPPARNHSAMVYDEARGRTILFGGHDGEFIFSDLWVYDRTGWKLVSEGFRPKRIDNGH